MAPRRCRSPRRGQSEVDRSLQIRDATTFQLHPVTDDAALHLATTRRRLKRPKRRAAEPAGPVRSERAMRTARDRVLGYTLARREIPTDEVIALVAFGRDDDAVAVQSGDRAKIRRDGSDG